MFVRARMFMAVCCFSIVALTALAGGPAGAPVDESSIRWKEHIKPISNALDLTCRLQGVYFDWKKQYGGAHDIGFIAEEVGKVVPEVVEWEVGGKDALGLKYERLTALLTEAIKEIRTRVDAISARVDTQQTQIDAQSQQLAQHAQQITSNTEMITRQEKQMLKMQKQMVALADKVDQLEIENEARIGEIDQLRQEVADLKDTCAQAATAAPSGAPAAITPK